MHGMMGKPGAKKKEAPKQKKPLYGIGKKLTKKG